jgi:hypothetical protein
MKESYERTEINITEFQQEDVIMTSTPDTDHNPLGKYMLPIK